VIRVHFASATFQAAHSIPRRSVLHPSRFKLGNIWSLSAADLAAAVLALLFSIFYVNPPADAKTRLQQTSRYETHEKLSSQVFENLMNETELLQLSLASGCASPLHLTAATIPAGNNADKVVAVPPH